MQEQRRFAQRQRKALRIDFPEETSEVAGLFPTLQPRRMQCEIQVVPAIDIDELTLAIGVFESNARRAPASVEKRANLYELPDDIGIPVACDWFLL